MMAYDDPFGIGIELGQARRNVPHRNMQRIGKGQSRSLRIRARRARLSLSPCFAARLQFDRLNFTDFPPSPSCPSSEFLVAVGIRVYRKEFTIERVLNENNSARTDADLMAVAIDEARHAAERGEVPVGAVVVIHSDVIGLGHNQPIAAHDPTAHAEVVAHSYGSRESWRVAARRRVALRYARAMRDVRRRDPKRTPCAGPIMARATTRPAHSVRFTTSAATDA